MGGYGALSRAQLETPALNWASGQEDMGKEERINGRQAPTAQKLGKVRERNGCVCLGEQSRLNWAEGGEIDP